MRRDDVSLLIDMTRAAMAQVSSIRQAAYALEDDGEVTKLIAGSLDEAYTELDMAEDDLSAYRATKVED